LKIIIEGFNCFKNISFLLILLFCNCSQEDLLIDNSNKDYLYLIQKSKGYLEVFSSENKEFTKLIISENNIGKIDFISKFRDNYYLINSSNKKIFVIKISNIANFLSKTLNEIPVEVVDFSEMNLTPISICFPNATDGYIAFDNSTIIGILDLTNNKFSNISSININNIPSNVAAYFPGNQVYVACQNNNKVFVIDTRTNTIEDSIEITDRPTFLKFTTDGKYCAVVSTGNGKNNNNSNEITEAKLSIIDVKKREIYLVRNLVTDQNTCLNLFPKSISISQNYLYVACQYLNNQNSNLKKFCAIRIPTDNFKTSFSMLKTDCVFVGYSNSYKQVFFVTNEKNLCEINFLSEINNKILFSIKLDSLTTAIID